MLFYARQYIFKTLSGFGCCLFSQAMMLWLLINCLLLLPLFCAVFCPSVYIQAPLWLWLFSVLTGGDALVVDLLLIVASMVCVVYTRQYIFKPLSGFGCCLFSQAMMLWLLIYCLLLFLLFVLFYARQYIFRPPQWLRLLSVPTGDDAVVVDLLFIVAPIVLCCFMPVSIYSSPPPQMASAAVCSHRR